MGLFAPAPTTPRSWAISVGAEGIAAAQFARYGFDVLVQTGHEKPSYDLLVTMSGNLMKIVVKGSEDGCWRLAQPFQRSASLSNKTTESHLAIDRWLDTHGSRTIYCLAQFEDVALDQLPRLYLAPPVELAQRMHASADRLGEAVLYERYECTSPETGLTALEAFPSAWRFSRERIHALHAPEMAAPIVMPKIRREPPVEIRPKTVAARPEPLREVALSV